MYSLSGSTAKCSNTVTKEWVYACVMALVNQGSIKYTVPGEELAKMCAVLAFKESTFCASAKNPAPKSTARGLFQIVISTQREIEQKHLPKKVIHDAAKMYDPAYAAWLGASYLAYQYKRYGNWRSALNAYNQGSVNKAGVGYANSALNLYNKFWVA